jgi:hypothetical protein
MNKAILEELIDIITEKEYTQERSLIVDAAMIIKELINSKSMERLYE